MSEEILINYTSRETRVAVLENGVLHELMIERVARLGLAGNIYMGKVTRVLPGMQAAFIEIGISRTAFLHASDIAPADPDAGAVGEPDIRKLVHEGQQLPVQVIKDPIGSKGARLTTRFAIPSRYLVMLPADNKLGVSSRIEDSDERERLKAAIEEITPANINFGYIVRTAAEGASPESLRADMMFLEKLWKSISAAAVTA